MYIVRDSKTKRYLPINYRTRPQQLPQHCIPKVFVSQKDARFAIKEWAKRKGSEPERTWDIVKLAEGPVTIVGDNCPLKDNADLLAAGTLDIDLTLDTPISELADDFISVRTMNCLKNENIKHIRDLTKYTEGELLRIPNFGVACLRELKAVLALVGIGFPDRRADGDGYVLAK